ncbi:MAG: sigma-70 family RNA polymerase sigma factor [Oscillospiraceae bacterium]|nr:sigma-70 family RNA polymerase sigma factor [Oscillospiraceae bacterium]
MDNGASSYRRFLAGDDEGIAELVRLYRDGLVYFICGFTGDIVIAEDIAEDVFVRLATKKPRFNERSSFKTWLYAIGGNEARSYLRKIKNAPLSLDESAQYASEYENPERAYFNDEKTRLLHSCMLNLKPEYRQALWLCYFDGFRAAEAAVIMKKSAHGMETLLYRARNALKNEMLKEGFTYEDL